jgi:hypothetical protein
MQNGVTIWVRSGNRPEAATIPPGTGTIIYDNLLPHQSLTFFAQLNVQQHLQRLQAHNLILNESVYWGKHLPRKYLD